MPIVTYLEQLRILSYFVGRISKADAEVTLRRAFATAGIPSSTYYRAIHGAELKSDTALQVATILRHQLTKDFSIGRDKSPPETALTSA